MGANNVRVGVVVFGSGAGLAIPLDAHWDKAALQRAVRNLVYPGGSTTFDQGLDILNNHVSGSTTERRRRPMTANAAAHPNTMKIFPPLMEENNCARTLLLQVLVGTRGDRSDPTIPNNVILITDGRIRVGNQAKLEQLKRRAAVVTVGRDADRGLLTRIATSPSHVITVSSLRRDHHPENFRLGDKTVQRSNRAHIHLFFCCSSLHGAAAAVTAAACQTRLPIIDRECSEISQASFVRLKMFSRLVNKTQPYPALPIPVDSFFAVVA